MSPITYTIMKMVLVLAIMFAGYYLIMILLLCHGKGEGWKSELIHSVIKLIISLLVILIQVVLINMTPL